MAGSAQDQYVERVLAKYAVDTGQYSPVVQTANAIAPSIREWAGRYLVDLGYSGSFAKGTAVHGGADLDLFISISPNTPETLSQVYESLFTLASSAAWSPRRQDVSVGTTVGRLSVDLVPGKQQSGYQNYHSLHRHRTGSWTQTNVALHISTVRDSGRTREIRALKIWRNLRRIDFPSFYLELMVIEALRGRSTTDLANNVLHALRYIDGNLGTTRIVDPANTNNLISADLTTAEKTSIAARARESATAGTWEEIIW